jgi:hypothetical protein
MGIIQCDLHGRSGVASMTLSAAKVFDDRKGTNSIVHVEFVSDDVSFFLYALKEELPFEKTKQVGQTFEADNEQVLDTIFSSLVPRCGKCVNEVMTRD